MSILSVNFSYVCLIYAEIFEEMSGCGLEVSFSICGEPCNYMEGTGNATIK